MLTDKELIRYTRHLLLDDIGLEGQQKLKAATVLIVGLGGLGCPAALYLVGAGIGRLILADGDKVEVSNLQRQIIYKANHVGDSKVSGAKKSLYGLNSLVTVDVVESFVDDNNVDALVAQADVVLDCSDNFATRQRINRSCFEQRKTLVSGAAIGLEGQFMVFDFATDAEAPCYRCLFPQADEQPARNCSNSGVFGPVLGIIGSMQALEAMKWLLGKPLESAGKLQIFDGMTLQWAQFAMTRNPECRCCGNR